MDHEIVALAEYYKSSRDFKGRASEAIRRLYWHYVKKRGSVLLESAAAAAALYGICLADRIDFSRITPQMEEAFNLAYPNVELSSLANRSPEEIEGFLAAWKGKYFEVLVRDNLNAGEWVGDIHLEPGQVAMLAEDATQPGWDLQILNSDGSVAGELQLKATESLSYVKEALERYPEIQVLTTDEVMAPEELADRILSSGLSNESLEKTVAEPVAPLLDSPLEDLVEGILPGLPLLMIAVGETKKVMAGRKSVQVALGDGIERVVKTGLAMGAGKVVIMLGGGFYSLPATFLTRLGIDRYKIANLLGKKLDKDMETIRALLPRQ